MTGRKPRAKDGVKLKDAGEPRWLVMVPWLAVDTLSVFDLAVLIHIKRITLEHGECYTSNRALAQKIGCSVSQLKKSKANLEAAGFITVEYERNEAGIINKPATITPVNVWPKNNALYDKLYKKQGENPSHQVATPSHQKATRGHRKTGGRLPGDTKENIQEEKKEIPDATAPASPPAQEKAKRTPKPKPQKTAEEIAREKAIAEVIEAWHKGHEGVGKAPYFNTGYRKDAGELLDEGFTAFDVHRYVTEQRAGWYKDKTVTWTYIKSNIRAWAKQHRPATQPASANGATSYRDELDRALKTILHPRTGQPLTSAQRSIARDLVTARHYDADAQLEALESILLEHVP